MLKSQTHTVSVLNDREDEAIDEFIELAKKLYKTDEYRSLKQDLKDGKITKSQFINTKRDLLVKFIKANPPR